LANITICIFLRTSIPVDSILVESETESRFSCYSIDHKLYSIINFLADANKITLTMMRVYLQSKLI